MRIRNPSTDQESCTNCGVLWETSLKYPGLCNNCFCPETYCTIIDDIVLQSVFLGKPLSQDTIAGIKKVIEDQMTISVVPVTWEDLRQKQPRAEILFEGNPQQNHYEI